MAKNYYKILGVNKGIGEAELKKTYYDLVKKYHPDVNKDPGAENKFKDIQEAYEAIKTGRADQSDYRDVPQPSRESVFADFAELERRFGGFGQGSFGTRGFETFTDPDIETEVRVEFLTGCLGGEVMVEYDLLDSCKECKSKYEKTSKFNDVKCGACNGSGRFTRRLGAAVVTTSCPTCRGRGEFNSCSICSGSKYIEQSKHVTIKIPAGIEDGQIFKIPNSGSYDYINKKYGDVYIRIVIGGHPEFRREGLDIFSKVDIEYTDCILGGVVEVNSIHGKQKIEIPKTVQQGYIIPISGIGVKSRTDQSIMGKHYFSINVKLPDHIESKEKKLLENIKKLRQK